MRKKLIYLVVILSFIIKINSYAYWDRLIPNSDKAEFLFDFLEKEYRATFRAEDIKQIRLIRNNLSWIVLLDRSRKDDVKELRHTINKDVKRLINKNKKKARYYVGKKWYISAAMQYTKVKTFNPFDKEALDYLKKHRTRIKNYIDKKKEEARKLIKDGSYKSAIIELNRAIKLNFYDPEIKILLDQCANGLKKEFRKAYREASILYRKKQYDAALKKINFALKIDSGSEKAKLLRAECYNHVKDKYVKKTGKGSKKGEDVTVYYKSALKYYESDQYRRALSEINKYLRGSNDKKGRVLRSNIIGALSDELMEEAVNNYNGQEYKKALGIFNEILKIEPGNEIAKDYKIRIEKRIKAFQ